MWIVRVALQRPYTFIVLAVLILVLSPVMILRTPTDIFPNIDIPVIAVAWQYTGMNPEELEGRLTNTFERLLTIVVDNIEHIESTTVNGQAIVKLYLQHGASLDTANAQVTSGSQTILRFLPPGTLPPLIINYSASTVPILQLGLSGNGLSEQQLNDLGQNFLRPQLVTVPGSVIPFLYGGKQRQVMIDLNPGLMQSKGLAPQDVLNAVQAQNLILPSGTAKMGPFEYDVRLNASTKTVPELNDLPVKVVGNSTIYLRDVANVRDAFAPQTNIVRQDGHRGALVSVLKAGNGSTIDVVKGIRGLLPRVAQTLPPEFKIVPLADQSIFVRGAVNGVIRETVIAGCLTGLMILLFLGSWRSTLIIAVSIPLSILTSVIILSFLGETINIMTLGGLALAVGMLVDDATVEIENINRNLAMGKETVQAILDGAQQIAVPALVSTLCICIVFLPMFFLGGVARYLFVPLAEAVVFAMLASYILSRTLVPTLAMYLLRPEQSGRLTVQGTLSCGSSRHSSENSNAFGRPTTPCSRRLSAGGSLFSPHVSCWPALRRFFSCHGSGRTSFRTPTAVSSSSIFGQKAARESRKPRSCATWLREQSAVRFPGARWITFLTTSVCLTAPSISCTARRASLGRVTPISWSRLRNVTMPRMITCCACARRCRVNTRGRPSTSYPRTSSRRS